MLSNSLFITYIIMAFICLQAITMIMLIIKHNQKGDTKVLRATLNFALTTMVLGGYYFFTYYRELVLGDYGADPVMRAVDATIFLFVGWTWIKLLDKITRSEAPSINKIRKLMDETFFILIFISATCYIIFLDEYYMTSSLGEEIMVVGVEILLGLVVAFFNLIFLLEGYKNVTEKGTKLFLVVTSILVNFNNIWNNALVISVFVNARKVDLVTSIFYGATSIAIIIINALLFIYIYKKDFSPIYFANLKDDSLKKEAGEYESMDMVSEKYALTMREREVFILAYEGKTNPEIADELFISKNTVKRHLHNIFEKTGISTRIELVHLVKDSNI